MPDHAHCPYCAREVEISTATDLAAAIDDGRDRSGQFLLTHWPTPTLAHQWTAREVELVWPDSDQWPPGDAPPHPADTEDQQ